MSFEFEKKTLTAILLIPLLSLIGIRWVEAAKKPAEAQLEQPQITTPENSEGCVACHEELTPGIVSQWKGSKHALTGIGCFECHQAKTDDADGFDHYGSYIATVVTPLDCARCHPKEAEEFQRSHHAAAGDILASLDNFLAETVEGSRANNCC